MQAVATAALAAGAWLGHAVMESQEPLLTQALNVMLGWGGLDPVFLVTPAAVGGGILLGALLGGPLVYADARGRGPSALALLALVVAYLALPRSLALEREHLLLDGWHIPLARVLSVKLVEDGVAVSLERFGWLTEQHLPAGAVADALQEQLEQRSGREP